MLYVYIVCFFVLFLHEMLLAYRDETWYDISLNTKKTIFFRYFFVLKLYFDSCILHVNLYVCLSQLLIFFQLMWNQKLKVSTGVIPRNSCPRTLHVCLIIIYMKVKHIETYRDSNKNLHFRVVCHAASLFLCHSFDYLSIKF